jgi:chromosome segregation ATPase
MANGRWTLWYVYPISAQVLDTNAEQQVEPDITRKSDKGRQTKTLSGGEKSFSTICMLLALWEAMGSPIRCLDEL